MNRKLFALCLVIVLTLALFAGCTDKPEESNTQAPNANPATEAVKTEAAAPETKAVTPDSKAGTTEAPATDAVQTEPEGTKTLSGDAKSIAESLIGSSVADLYAAIGEPQSSSYASSCDGPGDDGELYYEGFTVYTYREGDQETVKDVY